MTDLPDLKIKALVNFPADVIGDAGIDVNRIGGRYHLALGYGDFTPPISGVPDPTNQNVLIWNAITGEYKLASVGVLTGVSYEHLEITSIDPSLTMNAFSTANWYGAWFYLFMSRGTQGSPLPVNQDDVPFGLYVGGNDGAEVIPSAGLNAMVDGPVSVGSVPIAWTFNTGNLDNGGTERLRITSAGNIVTGGVAGGGYHIDFNKAAAFLNIGFSTWSNGAAATNLYFTHSRSNIIGGHTVLQNNDELAFIGFSGSDGVTFRDGAYIYVQVDGTPGFNDMPTRITIGTTPDGAGVPLERLRIDSAGHSIFKPGSAAVPTLANGQFTLTPTSNTNMRISHRGSDGVLRVANFTML